MFLLGPTASGKTGVGLELAQQCDCQLISCDSSLVYRGMDIGTAKPTADELRLAPHRLIDICEPSEPYSAAQFCSDARREIGEARKRGQIPVLLGGTMLYFNALEQGLAEMPAADDAVREAISTRAANSGWQTMHDELRRVDPAAAARIHPNDPQRIQRALEVWELTGRPISEWQKEQEKPDPDLQPILKFGLFPQDRAALHERIAARFELMLEAGFLDEVSRLRADNRNHPGLPSMRSVGYRQAWQYLEGDIDADTFKATALASTRQLAKRQLTWMRSMQSLELLDSLKMPAATIARRIHDACDDHLRLQHGTTRDGL